ncbi:MAG: exodeoxyribonuclease V subunit gamma [Deltaproteobacteria bacterium]|nr:exodeoxyribonuclease V subunit gamma [Deltaproteobacteria bacterium]
MYRGGDQGAIVYGLLESVNKRNLEQKRENNIYYLHTSNRTENLLHHLAAVIRADEQRKLFTEELFLIQSQGMERMVCQTLADEFGSFCNYRFMFPLHFLGFIAEKIGVQTVSAAYERQILTWRIEASLYHSGKGHLEEIQPYLMAENGGLKRFQLARKLAHIFDQYQVMRPEMLAGWMEGRRSTDDPAEKWQMELWQMLAAEPMSGEHRGVLFRHVIDRLASQDNLHNFLPKRVSVLGLHIMPPVFLEFLNNLARHSDVHLYILSPCKYYWGDVETRKTGLKRGLKSSSSQNHPLLASLGRQGRDFQKMMLENVDFEVEFESFIDPLEDSASPTLLQRLQSDLLHGELVQRIGASSPVNDGSIRIVSAHSIFREIGILKDHLLQLLYEDPSLQLRDILVMAPDIQKYAPLIPAVFDDIQYSIADTSLKRQNNYINVFLSFLDLLKGRFGWNEVMELLRQPAVFPHFGIAHTDLDLLQQWVLGSSIRWGLSEQQRRDMGISLFSQGSWAAGIERLLMGYAIDSDESVDGVFPFADIEGSGAEMVGGLCQFITVIEEAYTLLLSEHSLDGWSSIFLRLILQVFGESDHREYRELRNILMQPAETYGPYYEEKVGFDVIHEWFKMVVQESRSSKGFLRGKLTFCSMLPMRSVPFRVVCLLGLNDGVFPQNDTQPAFDLMGRESRLGDRSARADDRYQFLEAILAARSNLYLSYIGQSVRTNEAIPPSVVVSEFTDLLAGSYGVESLVAVHPLHPFNVKYFTERRDDNLFSYNRYYCTTAENLQKEIVPPVPWWQGELEGEIERISFKDLLAFYRNPQDWFVRNCLGINTRGDRELPEETESFKPGGLDGYMIEQNIIRHYLQEEDTDFLARIQAEGFWPLAGPGSLLYRQKMDELSPFIDSVRNQGMGAAVADTIFELDVGTFVLSGTLENLYENGIMLFRYARVKGKDLLSVWIHHLVANCLFRERKSVLVAADAVFSFSAQNQMPDLELMLKHFAEGCRRPSSFFVEPALSYCDQLMKKNTKVSPLEKAGKTLQTSLEKGYEPSWDLLLRGNRDEPVLGSDFEDFCLEIMNPIRRAADER